MVRPFAIPLGVKVPEVKRSPSPDAMRQTNA